MSGADPVSEEPSPLDAFLDWTGLWMVTVAPREFPEEGPRYRSLCMGLLWPMGMMVILGSWVGLGAAAARVSRDDARRDQAFALLLPIGIFVGTWVLGYVQLRARGATRSQRGQYLDVALRWMGNVGWLVQLLLCGAAVLAVRLTR